jgi:SAM-dependent methyltransferase
MRAHVKDFTTVTESPGTRVRREAIDMLATRYAFAERYVAGRRVLEVGCGVGQGLGRLQHAASWVVGSDLTAGLIRSARGHYGSRVPLLQCDAQALPFLRASFDVILLFEAVYYLPNTVAFLDECRRVLAPGGRVLINLVNCRWADFNPSPFSTTYYSAPDLRALFQSQGFDVELFGAYPLHADGFKSAVVSSIKRAAVALHLVPRTMKGKELLKRVFFGPLVDFPAELAAGQGQAEPIAPWPPTDPADRYMVIYAAAQVS